MPNHDRPALAPDRLKPLLRNAEHWLWRDVSDEPLWLRTAMRVLRTAVAAIRDMTEGQLTLRAMSLVYTTLLALVPLLAISFSILKGFGVHNQIEPFLLSILEPLGERSEEITFQIVDFVDNIQVGVLGVVGLMFLFYTAVSLMRKIELAFNETWEVARERRIAERFRDYFAVILLGPVLIFISLGVTATVMSTTLAQGVIGIEPVGRLVELASRLAPIVMIVFAFTFINMFVPNTRVRFASAFVGGAVSGLLWHGMGLMFAAFVAGATRYTAIYSGFATPILFMIWLYLGWLILLIGGTIAFYHQYPDYMPGRRLAVHLSFAEKEQLALSIVRMIGKRFYGVEAPLGVEAMARQLRVPSDVVGSLLAALERAGLVAPTAEDRPGYLPARPWEQASVYEALEAVRSGTHEDPGSRMAPDAAGQEVTRVLERLDKLSREAFEGLSLRDFVTDASPVPQVMAERRA